MKKITLSLVFLLAMVMGGYGQVTVGEGTNTAQNLPINAFYGYTYSQSIYLASEINASGSITSIQWYYSGTGAMPNSQGLTIYLGQTDKANFESNTDYVPLTSLTAVYTGGLPTGSVAGWKTITFTTPFAYDGIANLVVATDENTPGYDSSTDKFRNTAVGSNRSIFAYSDGTNTDPANPAAGSPTRGMVAFVPNIIFGGITQACPNPTAIVSSNATTSQVNVSWATATGQTEWEVYVVEQGSQAPTPATVGSTVTGTATYLKTGLNSNTAYAIYVRAKCSESLKSGWAGPKLFRTLCDPFGDFVEDFTATTPATGVVPSCWTKTITGANANVNISVISNTFASAPNAIYLTNSDDVNANILLVSPALTTLGANTHRMKFKARGGTVGQLLIMGTMSDATNAATFTPLQTITLGNTYMTYSFSVTTSTTDNHIAFKHGQGGTYRSVYLDDIEWEPIPTSAPGCIEDMNAVANEGCGNFPTVFTWAAVPGADGYKVSIGTSANGGDLVINELDIFSVLNYSLVGNPGTTYYYTVRPYNAFGNAVGCYEDNFTTYDDGCYCVVAPQYLDGQGIGNVQISDTNFAVSPVSYASFNEQGAVEITQGVNTVMSILFKTGYTYNTNIWIDFNDNYTFEPSEIVFTGESAAPNPTTLATSFFVPATANLGEHQMRIVATDNLQTPANPCYNASYGIVIDLLVDVQEAPNCLPPSASTVTNITANSAVLNWVSDGTLFNVEKLFAGEAQGTGEVFTGITGNSTTLTNLDAQADYAYYIQTNCGANGGLSPWTGPYTFRTGCEAFGDFTEDFTTEVNYFTPECWYSNKGTADQYAYIQNYAYNDYMQFYNSADANANMYLVTPSLTDLSANTHRIKFRAYSPTVGNSVIVGTMSDPSDVTTFTAVQTVQLTTAFADYAVAFVNSTTDMHVAFKFVGTGTYQYLYLDDVVWETAPSCPDIYVINFLGSTATTADISWAPGGTETAWQYAYGLSTVTDPTGLTPVDVATTPSVTIANLTASTNYKVWVRASCGTGFGNWSPAKPFTTACVAVTQFPWTESFENITTGFELFPLCWSKENGDYTTTTGGSYNSPRTGTNYLRISWSATNEFMWTPGFELTAGVSYDFSFYMQGDGYAGWNVDVFHNSVQNSAGATQIGETVTASGSGGLSAQPYVLVSNTFVPSTSGTYYFATRVNQASSSPWYLAFDDFRMEPTPSCLQPSAPTSEDVTITTATINWTETTPPPAGGYDYYITSDVAETPITTTVPTGTVGAGITTADLTGLTGSTFYKTYVRAVCSASDKSSWSDSGTLSTTCVTATLPYAINFESATIPNLPICTTIQNAGSGNNWKTAGAPGFGFDSKVLVYQWSANDGNAWFYTNTMSLVAGTTYSVSYEYGNDYDNYVESMKVSFGTTANATAMTTEIANHPVINQATKQLNTATFTPTISGEYVIGFNAYSESFQNYLFLDNILIQEVLGSSDFENKSFTAYPNPVKDILNVSFTQNISDITVFNLLGQQVLFMNMNANKGQVDMSALSSGTYLVKVNADNGVKTVKVIKE